MAKHTPGQWTLLPDPGGWTLHHNGQDVTAEAFDCTEADARLIAAAPELADACARVLDSWNVSEGRGTPALIIDEVRAALRKAGILD